MTYMFTYTPFHPSGRILQVDYANNCAIGADPSVGIVARDCVILATEKRIKSRLVEVETVKKIRTLGKHMGIVYAGLGSDYRVLATYAHKMAIEYNVTQSRPMPVNVMVNDIGDVLQEYTQSRGVRPFGVQLLVGAWYKRRPYLYNIDSSGSYLQSYVYAIGRQSEQRIAYLSNNYSNRISKDVAICSAIEAFKIDQNKELSPDHIEIAICNQDGYKPLQLSEIEEYMQILK